MKKLSALLVHLVMLALVCAVAAYWLVKIMTPQPTPAPPPLAAPPPREPNPVLAARLFGLVQTAPTVAVSNIQVTGVFVAGEDSSALLAVDGKPVRAYVVGQEITPGTRLVEVGAETVVIENGGGRQELQLPPRPTTNLAEGGVPAQMYVLRGNTVSPANGSSSNAGASPVVSPPNAFGVAPSSAPAGVPVGVPLPQDQEMAPPQMQDEPPPPRQ